MAKEAGMDKQKISVIVLTHNEEPIIKDCLESVKWADEIVVVDDNSTDATLEIVKKFGVKKIVHAPKDSNFSDRRNLGAKNASGEWLLYVDADERVSLELCNEIKDMTNPYNRFARTAHFSAGGEGKARFQASMEAYNLTPITYVAYAIPRKNIRLTKVLYHGGWWPDYVLRLMKKDSLVKWNGELHEQPEIKGEVGKLNEAFLHYSHRGSLEHKMQNTINWSKIEAQRMFDAGHPPMNTVRFLSAMGREFYLRMIKHQAFRDGTEGFMEAIYQVFSVFISYARLWELQQKNESSHN